MRYCQLVAGPAGSGKSTYCDTIQRHAEALRRLVKVVNLDPAAESFKYEPFADISELIKVEDVMEDEQLKLGPNGALLYCMDYLSQNLDWLMEAVGEDEDDDYVLLDCPGTDDRCVYLCSGDASGRQTERQQLYCGCTVRSSLNISDSRQQSIMKSQNCMIELYTHVPVMRQVVDKLKDHNFNVCAVFVMDSSFLTDVPKFFSGALVALSAMINLEAPHVNVLSKFDLLSEQQKEFIEQFLESELHLLNEYDDDGSNDRFAKLTRSLAQVINDYSLVKYVPLDINDDESINDLMLLVDSTIQYGEDLDVQDRLPDYVAEDERDDEPQNGLY